MAGWQENAIMYWNGERVSDHGRSPLSIEWARIGTDERTVNGTLRRQEVAKKRTLSASWENFPSKVSVGGLPTADGGWSGEQMEAFYRSAAGSTAFRVILRNGTAINKTVPTVADSALPYSDADFEIFKVMITDFSREVIKRGSKTDLWSLNVTLEEI